MRRQRPLLMWCGSLSGDHRAFHHPVVAQHDQCEQQLVQAVRLRRLARQQRHGLRVEHHEVGLTARLQVAHHAGQTQRLRATGPLKPQPERTTAPKLVLLGASTGGPHALARVLADLPEDFPAPVLVVQHLPGTWTASLAERLDALSPLPVREARPLDLLQAGQVLVVPGDRQVALQRTGTLTLYRRPGHTSPSVDLALNSAIEAFGAETLAVILTGMGSDGLEGVRKLKRLGGRCLAEHASSCVVYGMPRAIIEAGLADRSVPLERMSAEIIKLVMGKA